MSSPRRRLVQKYHFCVTRCTKTRRSSGYLDPQTETQTAERHYNHIVRKVSDNEAVLFVMTDFAFGLMTL